MADERFLRVARALALLTPLGCAAEPPPPPVATPPRPETEKVAADEPSVVQGDPTEGTGTCRCSWDNNAAAAPRVCKKGELAYNGGACVPGTRPKYPIAIGPLPPPDLPA